MIRRVVTCVLGALVAAAALLAGPTPALAHTGFESSSPAAGDVVSDPVGVVTLVFTGSPTSIADGFAALDGDGTVRAPSAVVVAAPGTFEVAFDPPLTGGEVGVRWSVQAQDGHVLEGGFSFTVDAPVAITVPVTDPTTTTTTTTAATSVDSAAPPAQADAPPDAASAPASVATTAPIASEQTESDPTESDPTESVVAPLDDTSVTLDEFIDEAEDGVIAGSGRALVGRLLGIPSTAIVVGGLAMLGWVFVGSRRHVAIGTLVVRGAAVVLAVGAVAEFLGSIAASGAQWSSTFSNGTERAMALRFVGAVVVAVGLRAATVPTSAARSLSAMVADAAVSADRVPTARRVRWDVRASSPVAVGVVMIVVSYWFDGHTVSRGWAPMHAVVNSVHLVAGSVWVAGVAMLVAVAWGGRRAGAISVSELVVRFSSAATGALVAVVLAGLVMAVLVLDSPSELWSSPWGRTLMVKTAAVAVAAGLGAFNHFVLRPELERSPDDDAVAVRLRTIVTAEGVALACVVVVTVWLVAART